MYLIFSKLNFFKNSDIGVITLILLFSIKVIVGVLYSYYFSSPSQIENADTWKYFIESKAETDWLLQNPKTFFKDLFTSNYTQQGGFFAGYNSYWNDLKTTFFIKSLAVLNVFTNKNYYINLLVFNGFFMVGCVAFYKLIKQYFAINKWLLIMAIFLTPSFLFWCSALHKDGIVFSATAIILYMFDSTINKGFSIKKITLLFVCFITIFALRNYYLLAIIPALTSWFLVVKYKLNSKMFFATIVSFCLIIFSFSTSFNATKSIGNSIVTKHNEFLMLEGNTKFITPSLQATSKSIINYFPFALQSALFRPFLLNTKSKAALFIAIENYFFITLFFISIVLMCTKKKQIAFHPIILVGFSISFFLLLFIGYTVCFDGAIVRYRSVLTPFLLVPCVLIIFGKISLKK